MKYTVDEFTKKIRKLYPGDYDDLSDSKLIELWLKKYPNDINKVDLNQSKVPVKRKNYTGYVLIIILLVLAIITKPDSEKHKYAIVNELLVPTVKRMISKVGINDLSSLPPMGIDLTTEALKKYLDEPGIISYKNYYFVSTIEFQGHPISFGAFGMVYIPDQVKNEFGKKADSIVGDIKSVLSLFN